MDKKSFGIGAVLGSVIGAAGMYFLMRYKMADDISEIVDHMRTHYQNKYGCQDGFVAKPKPEPKTSEEKDIVSEEECIINENPYVDYTRYKGRPVPFNVESAPASDESECGQYVADIGDDQNTEPYSVPPEYFEEENGYKKIILTWYEKNNVLAYDSNPHIVVDPEYWDEQVGNFKDHFGDWEAESVYIRNDVERIDYAIDACLTNYDEMIKVVPDDRAFNGGDDDD